MKPNVGIEPTTYRLIDFAVSILKLAPPQGFEPRNVGIKIRCLRPTWRRGYLIWLRIIWHFNWARTQAPQISCNTTW